MFSRLRAALWKVNTVKYKPKPTALRALSPLKPRNIGRHTKLSDKSKNITEDIINFKEIMNVKRNLYTFHSTTDQMIKSIKS